MNQEEVYQWAEEIGKAFRELSKPQRRNLALFSLGVVQARDCRLGVVAESLSHVGKADSVERRFQRLLSNTHLDMKTCSANWIRWVLSSWEGDGPLIVLVDETKLGQYLSVMMVALAYGQRCIPLVWRCYQTQAYPAEGQVQLITALLEQVRRLVPDNQPVLVQVDSGLGTSPALMRAIEHMEWYFLFRVQSSVHVQLEHGRDCPVLDLIQPGQRWSAQCPVFKGDEWQLNLFVHLIWKLPYDQPWCLLTNAPALSGDEYALRTWQEQGFRDLKSGGWKWDDSQVWQADHAQRLLLVLAIAYAWILTYGTRVLAAGVAARKHLSRGTRQRLSIFRLGLRAIADTHRSFQPLLFSLSFLAHLFPASSHILLC